MPRQLQRAPRARSSTSTCRGAAPTTSRARSPPSPRPTRCLDAKAANTDEAREAQLAMQHRRDSAEVRLQGLVDEIVDGAIVLKGGGTQVAGASLKDALLQAGQDAAVRLFPRFADADHSGWGTVVKRAGDGNAAALEAVAVHERRPRPIPYARRSSSSSAPGRRAPRSGRASRPLHTAGARTRSTARSSTLLAGDVVEARTDGVPVTAKQLTVPKIGVSTFTGADRSRSGRRRANGVPGDLPARRSRLQVRRGSREEQRAPPRPHRSRTIGWRPGTSA